MSWMVVEVGVGRQGAHGGRQRRLEMGELVWVSCSRRVAGGLAGRKPAGSPRYRPAKFLRGTAASTRRSVTRPPVPWVLMRLPEASVFWREMETTARRRRSKLVLPAAMLE